MEEIKNRPDRHHKTQKPPVKPIWAILFLIVTHTAGIIGLTNHLSSNLFQALTPFNLLLSVFVLMSYHNKHDRRFFIYAITVIVLGFISELAGVNTGLIFGPYKYDSALGFKIFNTPPMIGINWLILIYITAHMAGSITRKRIWIAIMGSLLMVLLDLFIEPVASLHGLWTWENNFVPVQNYIGWLVVGFIIHYTTLPILQPEKNPVALPLFIMQFTFFVVLNLINLIP